MFSLFARVLREISRHHKLVFLFTIVISLLCIYPVTHLRWELQIADMLGVNAKQTDLQKKLDEISILSLVLEGPDSAENRQVASQIAERLEKLPEVLLAAYEVDVDFYEKNKILFLPSEELSQIYERLVKAKGEAIAKQNPLIVQIDTPTEQPVSLHYEDFEKRNAQKISDIFQNENGTVRVIDVFPSNQITSLDSARNFISLVKGHVEPIIPPTVKVVYTGKIQQIVQTGRELLPKAKQAGWLMAGIFFILLFIAFFRQPQLIIPAGLPIALSTYWTLGLSYFLYGRVCLFSMLIVILLPGLAAQQVTHIFSRYNEERRKGLNPDLSLESAILGIGPVAAVSTAVVAAIFLSLLFIPMQGAHELAYLGAIGAVLNWFLCGSFTPALLRVVQKRRPFKIIGKIKPETINRNEVKPFRYRNAFSILLIVITIALVIKGIVPDYNYSFSSVELATASHADSLVATTGADFRDPVIISFPNQDELENYLQEFTEGKQKGKFSSIAKIYTLGNMLPTNQHYKLQVIKNIQKELESPLFENLHGKDSIAVNFLRQNLDVSEITEDLLPASSKKLLKLQRPNAMLATILPAISADDGRACRRISKDIKILDDENNYPTIGVALVRAEFLDNILRNLYKSIWFCAAVLFLILLLHYNKLSYSAFALIPPAAAFIWILSSLNIFGIELNLYSCMAFPLLVGLSIDGSIHFWNHYLTKREGSSISILRQNGKSIFISQVATLVGAISLLASSHQGLKSFGQISLIGIVLIIFANFFISPLSAAVLDAYRLRKSKGKT